MLNNFLDFLIIGLANLSVLLLISLFLSWVDYEEDKAYYKNLKYKNRGQKWNA